MSTATITGLIEDSTGNAISGVTVVARLRPAGFRTSDSAELVDVSTTTDGSGAWSLALERNEDITPAGTWYEIEEQVPAANGGPRTWAIDVDTSGTLRASLRTDPPSTPTTDYLDEDTANARYAYPAVATDGVRYVSTTGSDDNDGLSAGKAKATIQAAIDALPDDGGQVIILGGTYEVAEPITTSGDNVRITGMGAATVISAADGMNDTVLEVSGDDVVIEQLTVDGNSANQTPAGGAYFGVFLTDSARALLSGLVVRNCNSHGIVVDNDGGAWTEVRIESCVARGNGNVKTPDAPNLGNGIQCEGGNRLIVANCVCEQNVSDGIYLQSVIAGVIEGNICQSNRGYGIECTTNVQATTFSHNVCRDNTEAGFGADALVIFRGNTLVGNVCDGNGGAGILIVNGAGNPVDNQLIGNVCRNNSQPGKSRVDIGVVGEPTVTQTRDGIELSGVTRTTLVGNVCYDDQTPKTQRYGFSDGGGTTTVLLVGNNFVGNEDGATNLTGDDNTSVGNGAGVANMVRADLEIVGNTAVAGALLKLTDLNGADMTLGASVPDRVDATVVGQAAGGLFSLDLTNQRVGFGGQTSPAEKVDVTGNIKASGKALLTGGLGVGNSASASSPGTVTKKIEVFDAAGSSLGFLAVYSTIT